MPVIEIKSSKWKLVLYLILSVIGVLCGARQWLLTFSWGAGEFALSYVVVGAISLHYLLRDEAELVLDERGLSGPRIRFEVVEWDDISRFYTETLSPRTIYFEVFNEDKYPRRLALGERTLEALGARAEDYPFAIDLKRLPGRTGEILKVLNNQLAKSRKRRRVNSSGTQIFAVK